MPQIFGHCVTKRSPTNSAILELKLEATVLFFFQDQFIIIALVKNFAVTKYWNQFFFV